MIQLKIVKYWQEPSIDWIKDFFFQCAYTILLSGRNLFSFKIKWKRNVSENKILGNLKSRFTFSCFKDCEHWGNKILIISFSFCASSTSCCYEGQISSVLRLFISFVDRGPFIYSYIKVKVFLYHFDFQFLPLSNN